MSDSAKKLNLFVRIGRTGNVVESIGKREACKEVVIRVGKGSVSIVFKLRIAV
jgi:hypothetical protein